MTLRAKGKHNAPWNHRSPMEDNLEPVFDHNENGEIRVCRLERLCSKIFLYERSYAPHSVCWCIGSALNTCNYCLICENFTAVALIINLPLQSLVLWAELHWTLVLLIPADLVMNKECKQSCLRGCYIHNISAKPII